MSAVATCPQCRLQLSIPSEADASSVVKCPVCRSQFDLQSVTIAPVLEMIVVPPPSPAEEGEDPSTAFESPESEEVDFALADDTGDEINEQAAFESAEVEQFVEAPTDGDSIVDTSEDDTYVEDTPLADESTDWDKRPEADFLPDTIPDEALPNDSVENDPALDNGLTNDESLRETIELPGEVGGIEPSINPVVEQMPTAFTPSLENPKISARETLEDLSIGATVANFAAPPKDLQMWSGIADHEDAESDTELPAEEEEFSPAAEEIEEFPSELLQDDGTAEDVEEIAQEVDSVDTPEEAYEASAGTIEPIAELPVEPPPVAQEPWEVAEEMTTVEFSDDISVEEKSSEPQENEIQSPTEEPKFEIGAETAEIGSAEATVEYKPAPPELSVPTDFLEPESEPGREESNVADLTSDLASMPTAVDYEPVEEPSGQPWMAVPERPAYDETPEDLRSEGTEAFEVDDIESLRKESRSDEASARAPQHPSREHYQPPIPGMAAIGRSEESSSRNLQKLVGMACAGTLGVGLLGLGGWWTFDKLAGGDDAVVGSVAQAKREIPSAEPTLQRASFDSPAAIDQTGPSNPGEPTSFDPSRYGNGEAVPMDEPRLEPRLEPQSEPRSTPYVVNAPSYSMNDLARALGVVQNRQQQFANARLDDPETRGALASAYIAYCDLAEALTFFQDDPSRTDRTMLLLDSKDVFRAVLHGEGKRLEVSRLAKFWAEKSDRPHNGIFLAGQLTSVRRQGDVHEYRFESDLGEPWVFVTPNRIDHKIFSVGVELVVVGSLISDPARQISGYSGSAQTVIWASNVKALNRSNAAQKTPAMNPLTALPTR